MVKNVGTQGSKGLVTRKTSVKYQICNPHYSKDIRKVKVSDRTKELQTDRIKQYAPQSSILEA